MADSSARSVLTPRRWAPVSRQLVVAMLAIAGIAASLVLRFLLPGLRMSSDLPLLIVLLAGGSLLVPPLVWNAVHARFGSDQLAGISIITSLLLEEYLAGAIVVLMLSGG
jgi:hypothetical protein